MIVELAALPSTSPGTRAQLDRLALAYENAFNYSQRAWALCGSSPAAAVAPSKVP